MSNAIVALIMFIAALGALALFYGKLGNMSFWKVAANFPEKALEHISNDPAWVVLQESESAPGSGFAGPDGAGGHFHDAFDPAVAQYRLIVRALRKPPLSPLPRDFAASVAARVEQRSRAANEHVEIWLGRGLVMLLVLAGAAAVSVYFGESLRDLAENLTLPEPAAFRVQMVASWAAAIAACVGVSAAFNLARKR